MKKTIIILLLAFFAAEFSYGQFALGVKIGYNTSKLSSSIDSIKSGFNNGFHIGAWTRLGSRLYLAPEIQYTLSGSVFSLNGIKNWKQKVTIGSLDIPVLVGYKLIHNDLVTWRIELGPEASFVINKKVEDETLGGPIQKANLNSANWYLLGGTGVDFMFMKLDIRYQYGLNKLLKDVKSGTLTLDGNNQMWVVSLGFKLMGNK